MNQNKSTIKNRKKCEVTVAIILSIIVLTGMIIGSYTIISENRYVIDSKTGLYYDLAKCDVSELDEKYLTAIRNIDDVKNGIKPAACTTN